MVCKRLDVLAHSVFWGRLQADGQEFFTSYDEVHDSFDAMGLEENLLRGIYAYGMYATFVLFSEY